MLKALYIPTKWIFRTGISLLTEHFVLEQIVLGEYFVLEYSLLTEYVVLEQSYWLNISKWNIPTDWIYIYGTGIFSTNCIFLYWNNATEWIFCTRIFPNNWIFSTGKSYRLTIFPGIFPTNWIFWTGIFPTNGIFSTGIFLVAENVVLEYPYSLNILHRLICFCI